MSLAAATAATAAVLVDGRPAGSAVLIDRRYLLTAAHVLRRRFVPVDQVTLVFPAVRSPAGGTPAPLVAARVPAPPDAHPLDVAVLDLGQQPPDWLPAPVPLSPARRLPRRVGVFGFPLTEGKLRGVWCEFDTAGPTTAGTVQANWIRPVGTQRGHSGGPVLDPATGSVVGVLVEGSDAGQFDRFVPTSQIAKVWRLPRPWLLTGPEPGAVAEFRQRAYGQPRHGMTVDMFRGRRKAVDTARAWLTGPDTPGLPLVLTGQPGAGKSSVAARVVFELQETNVGTGLGFHARAAALGDLLTAVADLTGVSAASAGELIDELRRAGGGPWLIVVDALDEASTPRVLAPVLGDLAGLSSVRLVVATRPLTIGGEQTRFQSPGLLHHLKAASADSPNVIDLDSDRYFESAGMAVYAAVILTQTGVDAPARGRAWAAYRADPALCQRLAAAVAIRAQRNYLVAALAARELSDGQHPVDPAEPGFTDASIPANVGEALDRYLEGLERSGGKGASPVRALLTALAYARGAGIDNHTWLAFAHALGFAEVGASDLQQLRRLPVADYLVQTVVTAGAAPVVRLYHQALADELLRDRRTSGGYLASDDEAAILAALRPPQGWAAASGYARTHTADHAAAAGQLDTLLNDPGYLAAADPTHLVRQLSRASSPEARAAAAVYRQAAGHLKADDPIHNATRLNLVAITAGPRWLADGIAAQAHGAAHVRWAHLDPTSRVLQHQILSGHTARISSLAVATMGAGTRVVISGSADGAVRRWRLPDGQPMGRPLVHDDAVTAVAVGTLPDGTAVVVSASLDQTVRIWYTGDDDRARILRIHDAYVTALATAVLPDGTPVGISASRDRSIRVWRLADGRSIGDPIRCDGDEISVAAGRLTVGGVTVPVVVSGCVVAADTGREKVIRAWRLPHGEPVGVAVRHDVIRGDDRQPAAVDLAELPGGVPVVTSASGLDVDWWRLTDGHRLGHHDILGASALTTDRLPDGTPVAVTGGNLVNPNVYLIRLTDARRLHTLRGHSGGITAVAADLLGEGPLVVSGSDDTTVRVWRPGATTQAAGADSYDTDGIGAAPIAAAALRDGTPVVVSGGSRVRAWREPDGVLLWEGIHEHQGLGTYRDEVTSVATAVLPDDTPVVVSGGKHGTARIWRLDDGRSFGEPLRHHRDSVVALATASLAGAPVVISGGDDDRVVIWRLEDGQPVGNPLDHPRVRALTTTKVAGTPVIVSCNRHGKVRVWRIDDQRLVHTLDTGHHVFSFAVGSPPTATPLVATAGDTGIRVSRLDDGELLGPPLRHDDGAVLSVAIGWMGATPSLFSGGTWDSTVRVWRLDGHELMAVLNVPEPAYVYHVLSTSPSRLVVSTTAGILSLALPVTPGPA